jgi:hypothetical protein
MWGHAVISLFHPFDLYILIRQKIVLSFIKENFADKNKVILICNARRML